MGDIFKRTITAIVGATLFLGSYFLSAHLFSFLLFVIGVEILVIEWPRLAFHNKKLWYLVPFYPIAPIICLIYLNYYYQNIDPLVPLYPFFVCWAADVGGYVVGMMAGVHKLCPTISPKKSWEGLFGSIFFVLGLNSFFYFYRLLTPVFSLAKNFFSLTVISFGLAIFALLGDLFESYLKRRAGIKDTGRILPGHGGFLDRFDSSFFVVFLVLLLIFLNK